MIPPTRFRGPGPTFYFVFRGSLSETREHKIKNKMDSPHPPTRFRGAHLPQGEGGGGRGGGGGGHIATSSAWLGVTWRGFASLRVAWLGLAELAKEKKHAGTPPARIRAEWILLFKHANIGKKGCEPIKKNI